MIRVKKQSQAGGGGRSNSKPLLVGPLTMFVQTEWTVYENERYYETYCGY